MDEIKKSVEEAKAARAKAEAATKAGAAAPKEVKKEEKPKE